MGNKLIFGVIYTLCAAMLLFPDFVKDEKGETGATGATGATGEKIEAVQSEGTSDMQNEGAPSESSTQSGESEGETAGDSAVQETEPGESEGEESAPWPNEEPVRETTIAVFLSESGETKEMELEDFITRVVMAEMPRTFPIEALKAQADAARTYCMHRVRLARVHEGSDAGICTDHTHCMAYLSEEEACERWGEENAAEIYQTVRAAVEATSGEVLVWEGELISALFHASSYGATENAEAVWGSSYPYLISVESKEEAQVSEYRISLAELGALLRSRGTPDFSDALWGETNQIRLSYTEAGRIERLMMNGYAIKGTELRKALGLKSTSFDVAMEGETVVITVRGYGHGVGMSQRGAEAMANEGADYQQILFHYYSGVSLISLEQLECS